MSCGSIRRSEIGFASPRSLSTPARPLIWAERYDRKLEDVFAVQDEVARMIVSIIAAHMNKAEAERTLVKPPATWQAYDYFLRAANVYASYLSS